MTEKVVVKQKENGDLEAKTIIGTARIIRDSLSNATYIGFTGTPISSKDRSTREVFGDYIDIYDTTQTVEDGATRPVYYESRVIHLKLDENTLHLIDTEYDIMAQNADPYVIEKSKKELGQMEAILGADQTIDSLVSDILDHYENYRANILTGKAMIVAYSRPIAMKIYKRILELRPAWTEKVGVVMTQGNNDLEEWREIIGNKAHKDDLAKKFKDNSSPMKIAIVVDMWLTGFDVPSLATMYVYKPMAGHNLMQAIARVNRVFKDKEGGLVVDYVGIAAALKQAMNDYTTRDKKNYGDTDVSKAAYPKFLEKLEVCRDLFYGFDYAKFLIGSDLDKAKTINGGVNYILGKSVAEHELPDNEKTQNVYMKEALLLKQALSLCGSLVDERTRFEAAFFESVRTMIVRLMSGGIGKKFTLPEVNERINELLKSSIKSEGVINLFSDVQAEFSLFDPKFLEEIANMKEKNLAVELLKKLIAEQVSVYRRTNVVKSEKFSELIQRQIVKDFFIKFTKNLQKRCQKHCMVPGTSFDRLHFSVQQVFAEIRIVWQLVDIWLPAPLDFGQFQRVGCFQCMIVARHIQNIHSNIIQTPVTEIGGRFDSDTGIHIDWIYTNRQPDIAYLVRPEQFKIRALPQMFRKDLLYSFNFMFLFFCVKHFRVLLDKNFGAYHHQFSTRRLRLSVCHIC